MHIKKREFMGDDKMPLPPKPAEGQKEKSKGKKGLFGFLRKDSSDKKKKEKEPEEKKKKKDAIDDDLKRVEEEEQKDIREAQQEEKETEEAEKKLQAAVKEEQKAEQKLVAATETPSLAEELEKPKEPPRTSSDSEINLSDIEALEADLNKHMGQLREAPSDEQQEKTAVPAEETIKTQKTTSEEEPEKPSSEEPETEEVSRPARVKKATKKAKKSKKKRVAKKSRTSTSTTKPGEKLPKPRPLKMSVDVDTSSVTIPRKVKVRKRKAVEQYFRGLEKDHQKISRAITKTITKPKETVDPQHFFILKNGRPIKNLHELVRTLKSIDEDTFKHHVNEHRNDFANWLKDILKKEQLAERIRNKKAKEELLKILATYETKTREAFKQQRAEAKSWKADQLRLIERVRKARDALYTLQAELDEREKTLKKKAKAISQAKAFDIADYKKRMKAHYDAREQRFLEGLERKKKSVDKTRQQLLKEQEALKKTRQKATMTQRDYAKELKILDGKIKKLTTAQKKLEKMESGLKTKDAELKDRARVLNRKTKDVEVRERVLKRKTAKVDSTYAADLELKKAIEEMRAKLEQERDAIEQQGFREYVQEELKQLYPQHLDKVTNIDGALDVGKGKYADLYEYINHCRELLNQNKISDAQRFYNNLKDEFAKRSIPPKERERLHNKILELYDDIHLALMR